PHAGTDPRSRLPAPDDRASASPDGMRRTVNRTSVSVRQSIRPRVMVYWIVLLTLLLGSQPGGAATVGPSTALAAFDRGEYDRVLSIVATSPPDQKLPRALLRAVVLSYARLGRAEEGLPSYDTLSAAGDDRAVLRELAKSLVVAHVRDAAEHVRITAYMALGDV